MEKNEFMADCERLEESVRRLMDGEKWGVCYATMFGIFIGMLVQANEGNLELSKEQLKIMVDEVFRDFRQKKDV